MKRFSLSPRKRGSILILVAAALGAVLGASALAVDYGRLVLHRWKVQAAVDAAALGGAQELVCLPGQTGPDYAEAAQVAETLSSGNMAGEYTVSFPDSRTCRVEGGRDMSTFFASLVGISEVRISARASAGLSPAGSGTGIRPFAVEEPLAGFLFGEIYLLKLGPKGDEDDPGTEYAHNGNFHAVAIGGTGSNIYRDNIKYGSDVTLSVGDWLDTEPGNMSGPTDQGVDYILQQEIIEEGVDYILDQDVIAWEWYVNNPDALRESPRLITIPVIGDWSGVYGRSSVQVVAFANFFLEGVGGSGKDCEVYGRFVERVVPGSHGTATTDLGAYSVRLIE